MSQVIGARPLQELNLYDYLRAQPNAFLHFLCGEALAPSAGGRFRKVREGALRRFQVFDLLEDLSPCCWNEAGSHSRSIDEILAAVKAHNQGIDAQMAGGDKPGDRRNVTVTAIVLAR